MLDDVRNFLISNHMYVDDEWLSGCVEYLRENSGNTLSLTEVKTLAKEQWLLNDLKDICPGSLPPNLTAKKKTVLNGRYMLQINAALDIGTPAYQQYLKLQKVNMDNVEVTTRHEDKVPSHRMIKLYLTDGVQDIAGIEYRPMKNLTCNITPGCKLLLKGPVECRRGILLLTEASIELFGGDVADVAVSNSLPALLSAKLGLPLIQETDGNTTLNNQGNTEVPAPHSHVPTASSEYEFAPSRDQTSTVTRIVIDDDDDIFDHIENLETIRDPVKRPSTSGNENSEKRLKVEASTPNDADNFDLTFEDEELLREFDVPIDSQTETAPKVVSSEPFVYIKQINELSAMDKTGRVFKVKGQIIKLLSRLSVGTDGWRLKCTIVDGTGSLDVDFASALITKIVGYSPQDMMKLKKQMASNQEVKEKVQLELQKAKDKLQVLYCIIEITFLDVAKITNLIPFDSSHVYLLEKRMEKT